MSQITGIEEISVSVVSGNVSLQYGWEEPVELITTMYDTNYSFNSAHTSYIFSEFNPTRFRLQATENSVINNIIVRYSCNASNDENVEDLTYGYENMSIDCGSLNTYARTGYVIDDTYNSNRALKITFNGVNNKYVSLNPQIDVNKSRLDTPISGFNKFVFEVV